MYRLPKSSQAKHILKADPYQVGLGGDKIERAACEMPHINSCETNKTPWGIKASLPPNKVNLD